MILNGARRVITLVALRVDLLFP